MKKTILIISVLLLIALCGATLFACNPAAGEYTFTSMSAGSITISASNVENASLVLNKDKTYSFTFKGAGVSISESGSYTKDGDTITFLYGDSSTTATYEKGTITWDYGTYTLVFSKK